MFEISTEKSFSAAHHLREYNGPCEKMHGHNWLVRATVRCETLDNAGIGVDFKILKKLLGDILDKLDHEDLNVIFTDAIGNPSSENIARYVYREMGKNMGNTMVRTGTTVAARVWKVEVFETPGNGAAYFEHD